MPRFAAVASFHGGHLTSEQPDSPHLFVKNITGRVYVAVDAERHRAALFKLLRATLAR